MQRISELRDEDLLRMVFVDSNQYKPEALIYAKAEITKRGIASSQTSVIKDRYSMPGLSSAASGESIRPAIRPKSSLGVMLSATYLVSVVLVVNLSFSASGEDPIKMLILGILFLPQMFLFSCLGITTGPMEIGAVLNALIIYFMTLWLGRVLNKAKRKGHKRAGLCCIKQEEG